MRCWQVPLSLHMVHQQPEYIIGVCYPSARLKPSLRWVQFTMLSTRGWTERTLMDESGLGNWTHGDWYGLIGFKNVCLHKSNPWGVWISVIHPLAIPACMPALFLKHCGMHVLVVVPATQHRSSSLSSPLGETLACYLNSSLGALEMSLLSWHFLIPRWVELTSEFTRSFPDISCSTGSQSVSRVTHPPSLQLLYLHNVSILFFCVSTCFTACILSMYPEKWESFSRPCRWSQGRSRATLHCGMTAWAKP